MWIAIALAENLSLFVSAVCPSLAVSPLAGCDGLDSKTLQFLLAQSLAPRAQELSNVESMDSACSHLVPEESIEPRAEHARSSLAVVCSLLLLPIFVAFPSLFLVTFCLRLVLRPCWWEICILSRRFMDSPLLHCLFLCRSWWRNWVRGPLNRSPSRPSGLWTTLFQMWGKRDAR